MYKWMFSTFGRHLVNIAQGSFLILYVFAAGAYGLTREGPIIAFQYGLGGIFCCWIGGHILQRRWPNTGVLPWIASGAILAFGWSVTILGLIEDAITNEKLPGWENWFPEDLLTDAGSYYPDLSLAAMTLTSCLLAGMIIAIAIWRNPVWSRALLLTMVLTALGMVIFFLLQRTIGGPFLLKSLYSDQIFLSFATYRYWGNAAAFLSLFWPILAAICLHAALRRTMGWSFWIIPAALVFIANFLNVSKAGNILAIIGIILFALISFRHLRKALKRAARKFNARYFWVTLIPVAIIVASLPFAVSTKRWKEYSDRVDKEPESGRIAAYAAFVKMIPDAGWIGFGPGTFELAYRNYVEENPKIDRQPYWAAHEDYIQTLVEWGYIGTALWGLILIPGVFRLCAAASRRLDPSIEDLEDYKINWSDYVISFIKTIPQASNPLIAMGAFIGVLLVTLHAFVDFPMQVASIQFYFLVLIALGWSYRRPANGSPYEQHKAS